MIASRLFGVACRRRQAEEDGSSAALPVVRSTAAASTGTESNFDQLNGITFDGDPPGQ